MKGKEQPIPVSLGAGVFDGGQVCVCVEAVDGVPDSRRPPAGHLVTDGWRPAPSQTRETLKLVRNLRQEALHTAAEDTDVNKKLLVHYDLNSFQSQCSTSYCHGDHIVL